LTRRIGIVVLLVLAGCGNSGIEGTLAWRQDPTGGAGGVSGQVQNTTSNTQALNPKSMRLLDDHGRRIAGRIRVGTRSLGPHASTALTARWKTGKPVRIDYGAGTLALPSG
jgi:hypothetical protein